MSGCIRDCVTCLFMATHEDCHKDGGCLHTPNDFEKYRRTGQMPPMRYRHWVESDPVTQLARLHGLQLSGARNIVLGPGEAEVNALTSPEDTSKHLHYVAEQCGYAVGNLTHDKGDGRRSLTVWKDFGPFRIEWEYGRLVKILAGENEHVFWEADDKLLVGPT